MVRPEQRSEGCFPSQRRRNPRLVRPTPLGVQPSAETSDGTNASCFESRPKSVGEQATGDLCVNGAGDGPSDCRSFFSGDPVSVGATVSRDGIDADELKTARATIRATACAER